MTKIKKQCEECPNYFETFQHTKQFCSRKCAAKRKNLIFLKNNPKLDICPGTVGAIAEYKVIVDLLSKKYNVYKAASPSCPADLAITYLNTLYRVEVTSGYVTNYGKIFHNKKKDMQLGTFEILAIVMKDGRIFYEPELPVSNV